MIALLQRVSRASVEVNAIEIASISAGLLVFIAVERDDDQPTADRMLERIVSYRVFADQDGRMNRSLLDCGGGLLLVPQFTLAADTRKGTRAGFSRAATPERGAELFEYLLGEARDRLDRVEAGQFGAYMHVSLINDGPVTFWLQAGSRPADLPADL